jgi:hypothetical protein
MIEKTNPTALRLATVNGRPIPVSTKWTQAACRVSLEVWAVNHKQKLWRESSAAFARYQRTGSRADQLATVRAFNLFLVGAQ